MESKIKTNCVTIIMIICLGNILTNQIKKSSDHLTHANSLNLIQSTSTGVVSNKNIIIQTGEAGMSQADGFNGGKLGKMVTGKGERVSSTKVSFPQEFSNTPIMSHGIIMLDTDKNVNQRVSVTITDLTTKGFTVNFKTWWDTKVYGCVISWTAYGKSEKKSEEPEAKMP